MKKTITTIFTLLLCITTLYGNSDLERQSKVQMNIINLMALGDFNLGYERTLSNTLSTVGIVHYIPNSELAKQNTYNYPNLSINYGLRSYISTNLFGLFTPNISTEKGFGAYIELLGGLNKTEDNYFGSGILWLGVSQPINEDLYLDYGLGITRYLGDSELYDDVSNSKDIIPGFKFSLGIKL